MITRINYRPDQRDAIASVDGVSDALETAHDVPAARACMTCHGARASRVLGFSAVQLAHAAGPSSDELTFARLEAEGLVTAPTRQPLQLPGPETTSRALGYVHANCGSCHNSARPAS